MAFLELSTITKRFGQNIAVDGVSISVEQGEFLTLLGPSGCGKTTILRIVAGFESPTSGSVELDGEDITGRSPSKRPMGMVFQSYALFPHMTAEQNIAFGMRIKGQSGDLIKRRCAELLTLVGLSDKGRSFPHQLSGGQQQRVALARALAVEPKVLLLDEPLSALDAKVRVGLRDEIRRIQQQLHMTAIYVTHDQEEALAISDRIAVLATGRIEQIDKPEVIYSTPSTVFAATFVGASNRFAGTLTSAASGHFESDGRTLQVPPQPQLQDGSQALVLVRPEALSIRAQDGSAPVASDGANNEIPGTVLLRTFLGPFTRFQIKVTDALTLTVDVPSQRAQDFAVDQPVVAYFQPQACKVLPADAVVQIGVPVSEPAVL